MPEPNDEFIVQLREVHLNMGVKAKNISKNRGFMEVCIPIPEEEAKKYSIMSDTIYHATSDDGLYKHDLKAAGQQGEDKQLAKRFESLDNLKILGIWLIRQHHAKPGDLIKVTFREADTIELKYIPR